MIQPDKNILNMAQEGMIKPFESFLIREKNQKKLISYGLSSYGYDIRLSSKEFLVFERKPGSIVDPKKFGIENLRNTPLHEDEQGQYFVLPGLSYGLGVAVEALDVPSDIMVLCVGKSTYARCGIIVNVTPAEPGWQGYLTLEFSNSSSADCRVYANEGVAQLLFFKGEPCQIDYKKRNGKYQGQDESVNLAKI